MIEEILFFGLVQGSILALLALGLSLVYGVGGILNLAHGSFYLLATYLFYWFYKYLGQAGILIGIIMALIVTTIVGGVAYLVLIKPLQDTHVGVVLITFGIAFFFEQFVKLVPWSDEIFHTIPFLIQGSLRFMGVPFPAHYVLLIIFSLIIVSIVALFIKKSKLGKSIRAVSQDSEAAQLVGINSNRILMYTVMISAFLTAVAAVLYVPADFVAPHLGWTILTSSFAVVVLGGMGSLVGSVVGAYIIGYTTMITSYLIDPTVSSIIPIIIIVLMLVIRPRGIFGKKELRY
ncbi:MAG: branched-chain amino acid ABC transporter permease [Candidatus Thorarchaeota archaeon]